jgi:hypothetical protein
MGRKVDVDDLVDATEVASRFGVARQSVVHDWRRRHEDFPEPVYARGRVRLWSWPDLAKWGRRTDRLRADGSVNG